MKRSYQCGAEKRKKLQVVNKAKLKISKLDKFFCKRGSSSASPTATPISDVPTVIDVSSATVTDIINDYSLKRARKKPM